MTVIVGVKVDEGILLGADTGMTGDFGRRGSGISVVCNMHLNKLTALTLDGGEELVWGAAGMWFPIQVLQKQWRPGAPGESTEDYLWNIVQDAFRLLYQASEGRPKIVEDEDYEDTLGLEMLIGFRGDIWAVTGEGCVDRCADDFVAVGSASLVSYGALYGSAKADMTPKERLTLALDAAVHLSTEIRAPYTFASAKKETV
jgi:hypothetical protein